MFVYKKLNIYLMTRDRTLLLLLLAMVFVIYVPFLGNPFIFDDLNFLIVDVYQHYSGDLFKFELRWLPYVSLGQTYILFSNIHTYLYHAVNLLLHAATVIALFYWLRKITVTLIHNSENDLRIRWSTWLGALIFAVHPVAVYATGYIIQRSIVMATLFVLLMQLAYMRMLISGQWRWLLLTVLAYFLAVYSKEHSVLAPALLAAETILLRGQIRCSFRVLGITWLALVLVGVHIVLLAKGVFGVPYEPMASALFEQQQLVAGTPELFVLSVLTQAGLFFKYLGLWLLPNPAWMSIDMRVPFLVSTTSWQAVLGGVTFVSYGIVGIWFLRRPRWQGLLGLAMLYPWLLFLVEFSSIRVQETFVLYRSYLWMPGLMLLIPLLVLKVPGRNTLLGIGAVVLLLLPLSWNRLWVFGDNYRLWNDAALLLKNEQVEGADRIFYNRGISPSPDKKSDDSVADLQRALALSPKMAQLHYALGNEYFKTSRLEDALIQFDEAIKLDPKDAQSYFSKGIILKRKHEDVLALQQIQKACELKNVSACMIVSMSKNVQK